MGQARKLKFCLHRPVPQVNHLTRWCGSTNLHEFPEKLRTAFDTHTQPPPSFRDYSLHIFTIFLKFVAPKNDQIWTMANTHFFGSEINPLEFFRKFVQIQNRIIPKDNEDNGVDICPDLGSSLISFWWGSTSTDCLPPLGGQAGQSLSCRWWSDFIEFPQPCPSPPSHSWNEKSYRRSAGEGGGQDWPYKIDIFWKLWVRIDKVGLLSCIARIT